MCEQLEEAFCHGVVMAIAPAAHAGLQIVVLQEVLPLMAGNFPLQHRFRTDYHDRMLTITLVRRGYLHFPPASPLIIGVGIMKKFQPITGVILLSLVCSVWAAGGGGGNSGKSAAANIPQDPVIHAAQDSIAREDWTGAKALLKKALESNPANADYHNLYAFATRKGPDPDMALVFAEYAEALRLDPKHRGAHEYLGEAYLQTNNLPKAKEQLAILDKLCFFGCEEYSDLKRSIQQYEKMLPQ